MIIQVCRCHEDDDSHDNHIPTTTQFANHTTTTTSTTTTTTKNPYVDYTFVAREYEICDSWNDTNCINQYTNLAPFNGSKFIFSQFYFRKSKNFRKYISLSCKS